jgi:hypothetical protein
MKLAIYRTEKGAARYAAEIMRHFPSVKAQTVIVSDFKYGVKVTLASGKSAYAGKRPRGYGSMTAAQTSIPNREGL